jgi:hypothetical protein
MTDTAVLDRAFAHIMRCFVGTGQAPHYTELANELGVSIEEGRQLIADLMNAGVPGWLHPQTDYIASFPPFNNQPTQYRISIDGHQKWFAQWGFESLAVRWLFPGKTVRVDAPCLDCGEPMIVEMRDEQVLSVQPATMVGYAYSQVGGPAENRPFRWAGMNLFRSEEHARKWAKFNLEFEKTFKPLSFWLEVFSGEMFRARTRPDFISWLRSEEGKKAVQSTMAKLQ